MIQLIKRSEMMGISLAPAEVCSIGTAPIEVLGFKNERELEEALRPLMQEIKQDDLIAA